MARDIFRETFFLAQAIREAESRSMREPVDAIERYQEERRQERMRLVDLYKGHEGHDCFLWADKMVCRTCDPKAVAENPEDGQIKTWEVI